MCIYVSSTHTQNWNAIQTKNSFSKHTISHYKNWNIFAMQTPSLLCLTITLYIYLIDHCKIKITINYYKNKRITAIENFLKSLHLARLHHNLWCIWSKLHFLWQILTLILTRFNIKYIISNDEHSVCFFAWNWS